MKPKIVIPTLALSLVITGVTCALIMRDKPHQDAPQSSTENSIGKHYDSVQAQKHQQNPAGSRAQNSSQTRILPDGSSIATDDSHPMFGAIGIDQLNDMLCKSAIKQISKYITLSEDEQIALHALLKKHNKGRSKIEIIAPGMDDLDADTQDKITESISQFAPGLGGSNSWYNNQDFLLDAPSILGEEKGAQLMEKANKLDYLDRDTQATQKVNNVQRGTDLTAEEAKSLKQLYLEHPNSSDKQLSKVLPENKVQQAKSANPANIQFQIIEP